MLNCQNNIFLVKDQIICTGSNKKLGNSKVIKAEPLLVGGYKFDTLPYRQFLTTTFHPEVFLNICLPSGIGKAECPT